jgi:hypothetical protein
MEPKRFRLPPDLLPPEPAAPMPPSDAFVICPIGFFIPVSPELAAWQQAVYQWAYSQAQQLLQPSLMERDWLGVWN